MAQVGLPWLPWLWTLTAAAEAGEFARRQLAGLVAGAGRTGGAPPFASPHAKAGETRLLELTDFPAEARDPRVLLVTPYALHGPVAADLAPGHSIVEALLRGGVPALRLLAWRSARPGMEQVGIDDHVAALNVVVDDMGGRVAMVGLCQGGWLALAYAARFPRKVSRLALAGAPVDMEAGSSALVDAARAATPSQMDELVRAGEGLVCGARMRGFWEDNALGENGIARILGREDVPEELQARFASWDSYALDLPGRYWTEVTRHIFQENALARGELVVLGRRVTLADVTCPLHVLAGRDDLVAPPEQALAAARHVGSPTRQVTTAVAPCGHLALLMGAPALRREWKDVARFLTGGQDETGTTPRRRGRAERPRKKGSA